MGGVPPFKLPSVPPGWDHDPSLHPGTWGGGSLGTCPGALFQGLFPSLYHSARELPPFLALHSVTTKDMTYCCPKGMHASRGQQHGLLMKHEVGA